MTDIKVTDIIEGLINQEASDYAAPGQFDTEAAAARVVEAIELGQHGEVLRYLVHDKLSGVIFGLRPFDEALGESYAKVDEVSFTVAYEISRQGRHFPAQVSIGAIKDLAEDAIISRGMVLRSCAEGIQQGARRTDPVLTKSSGRRRPRQSGRGPRKEHDEQDDPSEGEHRRPAGTSPSRSGRCSRRSTPVRRPWRT